MKTPKNPQITELTKSHKERSIQLTKLKAVKKPDNSRWCAWCSDVKLSHGNQKYCGPDCSNSAMAWAYPQSEYGLYELLLRQGWKCAICAYDYLPTLGPILVRYNWKLEDGFNWGVMKVLKMKASDPHRPEVDHIVPIYKGGQSIGLDNHQCICYTCHKVKTKTDLSGKRK